MWLKKNPPTPWEPLICLRSYPPARHCSNSRCCQGCWGPQMEPSFPDFPMAWEIQARQDMEMDRGPPDRRCWTMKNGHFQAQLRFSSWYISNLFLHNWWHQFHPVTQTHLASGSSSSSIFGSSVCDSEKSKARLVSFFWRNLRESLFLLTGLPRAAATFSPCRTGISVIGRALLYTDATAQLTGKIRKCAAKLNIRRLSVKTKVCAHKVHPAILHNHNQNTSLKYPQNKPVLV